MWNMVDDMMPNMSRMWTRRKSGMNTATAMLLGAGIGIAAWEVMRRNNSTGKLTNGMSGNDGMHGKHDTNSQNQHESNRQEQNAHGASDMDNNTVTEMAKDIMNAIQ